MAKSLDNSSKFNIYASFNLSNDDVNVLSLLYAPLIGSEALMLYLSFSSLLERNNLKSEELMHQDFFDLYSLTANQFLKNRYKLEGIGLLTVYQKDNSYIYVLSAPLTAKNFIKDATLGLYLYSKVRKETFDYIYDHFKIEKIDKVSYENITKSFDEVFESSVSNDLSFDKFKYILGKVPNKNIIIKNYGFDFDLFIKGIDTSFLENGVTKTFKDQICNLAFVYNFTEPEMINLFFDSLNRNNTFDYRLLKKKANEVFNYKRNKNAPNLKEIEDEYLNEKDTVSYLENTPISVLLEQASPNFPAKYLSICNDIYANIDLPKGVLNCMILKTLKDKSGELPNLAYMKKMASTWMEYNIFSTIDAINYVTSAKLPTNTTSMKDDNENDDNDNGGFRSL